MMERNDRYKDINYLQELGSRTAENLPDIKGWPVKNTQGQMIGVVKELLFDVQSRKVHYMVVDSESSVLKLDSRVVLVPLWLTQLHEPGELVILPDITVERLWALPIYDPVNFRRFPGKSGIDCDEFYDFV